METMHRTSRRPSAVVTFMARGCKHPLAPRSPNRHPAWRPKSTTSRGRLIAHARDFDESVDQYGAGVHERQLPAHVA